MSVFQGRGIRRSVVVAIACAPLAASADPTGPSETEAGLFAGAFISNYYHQFYDASKWPGMTRPDLDRLSPQFGARYAVYPHRYVGIEGEGSLIVARTTGMMVDTAKIYGLRVQAIAQLPGRLTPFVAAGFGLAHTSSDTLGSDTDWPIHVGGGVRFFATRAVVLRADVRFLRGPSEQSPYTLNASYGEFSVGVSWVPGLRDEPVPPRPAPIVPAPEPPRDTDGDGILDRDDACPAEAETVNGWQDSDGCPDTVPDTDGDGLDDLHDKCPDQAEDKDGFQDEDGCPDPDNDGDGVADDKDRCPTVAGVADNAGCPDPDSDGDGLVDRLDNCPGEAGTLANRGCLTAQVVSIGRTELVLANPIAFGTNSAKLSPRSRVTLDAVARLLLVHSSDLWKISVDVFDAKLADERAAAVVKYLRGKGVAPERLQAIGHPDDQKGRVELHIVAE